MTRKYVQFPADALDADLSRPALALYLELLAWGPTPVVEVPKIVLAQMVYTSNIPAGVGISLVGAERFLNELQAHGLVAVVGRTVDHLHIRVRDENGEPF